MEPNKNTGLILVLVVAMLWSGAAAQSSACTDALVSLSSCINYITGNTSTPSSRCCSHLADIVSSESHCLCEALNMDPSSLGINVNQTQVVALPGACNIQTPPLSACSADSPAGAPESPNMHPTGSRSNTVPSTQSDGASDASSATLSISLLFVLFLASFSMH